MSLLKLRRRAGISFDGQLLWKLNWDLILQTDCISDVKWVEPSKEKHGAWRNNCELRIANFLEQEKKTSAPH
jgi:hypothetical protein